MKGININLSFLHTPLSFLDFTAETSNINLGNLNIHATKQTNEVLKTNPSSC